MKNSWETVTVDNSLMRLYLSQPDGPGPFPTMVVVQNQDGVGAFTQEMTRRVAQAGYVGIAPELYHREGEPKTPEQVADIKRTRNDTHVINDINAAVKFLRGCATADTSRLGIIGFCMGGRIAFLMGAADPSFKAAVDFYGGGSTQNGAIGPRLRNWRRMFRARSRATSVSSIKTRRRMKCANSTRS
jgi:carboxymethylenebutenolidase